jgi:multicomponent Na+:H+ antiporter subunit E
VSVRRWPVVGAALAGLWLLVRGVAFEPAALAGEALIGIGVGLTIAYGLRRMFRPEIDLLGHSRRLPLAGYYVVTFLWEVLTANLDVAYRVLAPSMPIEPDVVEVPLRVESDAAITSIANSITLTPGTLTMDHDRETNTLYVHGIVGTRREAVLEPIRRWEDLLLVIFDEAADPGDDPPEPPSTRAPLARDDADRDAGGDHDAGDTGQDAGGDHDAGDTGQDAGGDHDAGTAAGGEDGGD